MITQQQVEQFERDGAVTVDTPLTPHEVQAAVAALERLTPYQPARPGETQRLRFGANHPETFEPALVDIIQHPWFEQVAKRVLRAQRVVFFQTAINTTYPAPAGHTQEHSFHIDMQYTSADFHATPRQTQMSFFLWLTDVSALQAPLTYFPGSHHQLSSFWAKLPQLQGWMPRIHGVSREQLQEAGESIQGTPSLATARAGQATILTTGMLHSASTNFDSSERRVLVITFTPDVVAVGLPKKQAEAKRRYDALLRAHLRPERRHIVAADAIDCPYGPRYYEKWLSIEYEPGISAAPTTSDSRSRTARM